MTDGDVDDGAERIEQAKLWLTGAVGFVEAARALLGMHKAGAMLHWPAFYVNLCFSYELSFKGFLAYNGWSSERLRRQLGHDLQSALAECRASGFMPHSQELKDMIEILEPVHKAHGVRYLQGDQVILPADADGACRMAFEHVQALGAQIGAHGWGN